MRRYALWNIKHYCVRRRKNALLIRVGVEIVWDNLDSMDGWILGRTSGIPHRFFAGDRMTSQKRESLGSRSSNALHNL